MSKPVETAASTRVIDLAALFNERPIGPFQILTIFLCGLLVFTEGYDAQAIGYAAPALSVAWKISRGALVPIFASGLTGIMIGSLFIAPLADRFGRRRILLMSTLGFALVMLATAISRDMFTLTVLRFLTGLGVGGSMVNAITLTSEYSSPRRRALLIILMFCGYSLGSAAGGLVGVELIPYYGWQAVFWFGGLMTLGLFPFLVILLPESISFLAARNSADPKALKLLARIAPDTRGSARIQLEEIKTSRGSVIELLSHGRARITVLLWIVFFMSLLDLNVIVAWLPMTLAAAGTAMSQAVAAGSVFQLGGIIGSILLALTSHRLGVGWMLTVAYLVAALSIALIAYTHNGSAVTMLAVAGAGFGIAGGQTCANALPAVFYPTTIRSTGVGWALGIGRVGAIVGPMVGGTLFALDWPTRELFLLCIIPMIVAAFASMLVQLSLHRYPTDQPPDVSASQYHPDDVADGIAPSPFHERQVGAAARLPHD